VRGMTHWLRWFALVCCCAWLGACSTWPGMTQEAPRLRLSPASLGRDLAVVQNMEVEIKGRTMSFDAALEVDQAEVRLAVLQLGQTIAKLTWSGEQLSTVLAPGWPEMVPAEQVLSDLQYVWWPRVCIQAALPPGWHLVEKPLGRELMHGERPVLSVSVLRAGVIELRHLGPGYTVRLHTDGDQPVFVATP
jgi:hypothetical protein